MRGKSKIRHWCSSCHNLVLTILEHLLNTRLLPGTTHDGNAGLAPAMTLHSPTLKASTFNKHDGHHAGFRLVATGEAQTSLTQTRSPITLLVKTDSSFPMPCILRWPQKKPSWMSLEATEHRPLLSHFELHNASLIPALVTSAHKSLGKSILRKYHATLYHNCIITLFDATIFYNLFDKVLTRFLVVTTSESALQALLL